MKILKSGEYYGQRKKELNVNGFILSEYAYDIPRTDLHYHENPYFMYLLQGQVYDVNKKIEKRCNAGALLFHNWQEQHYNAKHSSFAKGFHIEIKTDYLNKIQSGALKKEGSISVKNPNAHILLSRLYYEFQLQDSFSETGIESLLISLCENIENDHSIVNSEPIWLNSLRELIHEEDEPKTLTELSTAIGVHPVHLSRSFSKWFGCTLSEYIRRVKVGKSISYLLAGKYNLTEISYLCGFADQSHFSRTFKCQIGMSPRAYKNVAISRC